MTTRPPSDARAGTPDRWSRRAFITAGAAAAPLLVVGAKVVGAVERSAVRSRYVKDIAFPVDGHATWFDTFGACRDGCRRRHEGQDIFGRKHQTLLACVSGTVVVLRHGHTGNSLYIRSDADGWYYGYLHINNDTPGTDDGRNAWRYAFAPAVWQGAHVRRGQRIAYMGDSGNAEHVLPHLHFEIRKPAGSVWSAPAVNPKYSLWAARLRRPAVDVPSGSPPVRRGDLGLEVAALQRALNYGSGSRLALDGAFGPRTELALKRLQRWCRLTVDGIYGPMSERVLRVACTR